MLSEKAQWLQVLPKPDPICEDEPTASLPSKIQVEPTSSISFTSPSDSGLRSFSSSRDNIGSPNSRFTDLDSDTEATSETNSTASCDSECCVAATRAEALSFRARVLAYLEYPSYFVDERDTVLAKEYLENIFRYVVSRTPRLLVRARNDNCDSVACFLENSELQEEDFARLWRALKYNNVLQEGKLSVQVIRDAIWEAENLVQGGRKGPYVDLLGGRVWKNSGETELSARGWDHFYRFVSATTFGKYPSMLKLLLPTSPLRM